MANTITAKMKGRYKEDVSSALSAGLSEAMSTVIALIKVMKSTMIRRESSLQRAFTLLVNGVLLSLFKDY
ncbi:hypothetical protein C5Y44_09375 [Corynebacterium sp. J010B-136]|nr:hypothetical protein C5Y44_09375 [Corynebacterium sp. J010B-136]